MPINVNNENTPNMVRQTIIDDHRILEIYAKHLLSGIKKARPYITKQRNDTKTILTLFDLGSVISENNVKEVDSALKFWLPDSTKDDFFKRITIENRNRELDIISIFRDDNLNKLVSIVKDYTKWFQIKAPANAGLKHYIELALNSEKAFKTAVLPEFSK